MENMMCSEEPITIEVDPMMLIKQEPGDNDSISCDSMSPTTSCDTDDERLNNNQLPKLHTIPEKYRTSKSLRISNGIPSIRNNVDLSNRSHYENRSIPVMVKTETPETIVSCPKFIGPDYLSDESESPDTQTRQKSLQDRLHNITVEQVALNEVLQKAHHSFITTWDQPKRMFIDGGIDIANANSHATKCKTSTVRPSHRVKTFLVNDAGAFHEPLLPGQRCFPCRYCPKMFPGGASRRKHERWHEKRNEEQRSTNPVSNSAEQITNGANDDRVQKPHAQEAPQELLEAPEEITVEPLFPCGSEDDDDFSTEEDRCPTPVPTDDGRTDAKDTEEPSRKSPCLANEHCEKTCKKNLVAGGKEYVCKFCDKQLSSSTAKLYHERTHTGEKPFQCTYCEKTFSKKDYKIKHERTHTGEKPYPCQFCDKAFSSRERQIHHERIHTGEKPFPCRYCDKSFTSSGSQRAHEQLHNEKIYECRFCDRRFKIVGKKNYHERMQHGGGVKRPRKVLIQHDAK